MSWLDAYNVYVGLYLWWRDMWSVLAGVMLATVVLGAFALGAFYAETEEEEY